MTDAFEILAADHQEVKRMLAQFESGPGDLGQLAETLVVEESKHEAVEEMYVWPSVREKVAGGDLLPTPPSATESAELGDPPAA